MRVVALRAVILVAALLAWELGARAANPLLYVPPSAAELRSEKSEKARSSTSTVVGCVSELPPTDEAG